jgi:hypothetical protein
MSPLAQAGPILVNLSNHDPNYGPLAPAGPILVYSFNCDPNYSLPGYFSGQFFIKQDADKLKMLLFFLLMYSNDLLSKQIQLSVTRIRVTEEHVPGF